MGAFGIPVGVCSARKRPSVQRAGKGSQWWKRDPYHIRGDGNRTLCGYDCSEWLVIGELEELDANCCERCLAKHEAARERLIAAAPELYEAVEAWLADFDDDRRDLQLEYDHAARFRLLLAKARGDVRGQP